MADEREVAGMRCGEVLAELSDYLDGDLARDRVTQVEAHLRGCDACERFGKEFAAAVHALRRGALLPAVEPEVFERLRARLQAVARE
jgi:anti-sigma factor RsiW